MKKPPSKFLKSNVAEAPSNSSLKEEESKELADFCQEVSFEDISFSTWQKSIKSLDLKIPIFLSSQEAKTGLKREVKYTQTIFYLKADGKKSYRKEKVNMLVQINPGICDGDHMSFESKGDRSGNHKGKLILFFIVQK
ncbi:MAG: hypothetical protein CMP11_00445 [Zetaproteobacteria bacterium]|nr:hypothetical protein [Pseudobdellovibrionaceae bacterium]